MTQTEIVLLQDININDEESLKKALSKLKNTYENYWKNINKINTSIKLPLTIALDVSEYNKILNFENVLDKLDLVSNYEISQFNNKIIYYKLIYNGSPDKFISSLKENGIELDIQNQEWKIK